MIDQITITTNVFTRQFLSLIRCKQAAVHISRAQQTGQLSPHVLPDSITLHQVQGLSIVPADYDDFLAVARGYSSEGASVGEHRS